MESSLWKEPQTALLVVPAYNRPSTTPYCLLMRTCLILLRSILLNACSLDGSRCQVMIVICLERCDGVPTHVLIVSTVTPQTLPNVFFIFRWREHRVQERCIRGLTQECWLSWMKRLATTPHIVSVSCILCEHTSAL